MPTSWRERISIDPEVRSGQPSIRGTRITVYDILEYLAGGLTQEQVLEDFPSLTIGDIEACLAFKAGLKDKFRGRATSRVEEANHITRHITASAEYPGTKCSKVAHRCRFC
jgi:uncharacterized protein (DUF433 family)